MESSSTDSPTFLPNEPEQTRAENIGLVEEKDQHSEAGQNASPSGFFLPHLPESLLGSRWRQVVSEVPSCVEPACTWVEPRFATPNTVTSVRRQFGDAANRIPHVCLRQILKAEQAEAIHQALLQAKFKRHHFAAYPLWVAHRGDQEPSALTGFMDWLASKEGALYHRWLVGAPYPVPRSWQIQVQTSHMSVGDRFPMHDDTGEEGIAVVYNLSKDWKDGYGGDLFFPNRDQTRCELYVPSRFNQVFVFRPKGATHGVSPVELKSHGHYRYTITAFYLAPPANM